MSNIKKHIRTQIKNSKFILENHITNDTGERYYHKRSAYFKTKDLVDNFLQGKNKERRWIIIPGLRGVGKTTILAQIYFYLLESGLDKSRCLFLSLDDTVETMGYSLEEAISAYEFFIGKKLEKIEQPHFIFIDESQYEDNWSNIIRTKIYNKTKQVFILSTGSSALKLQNNPDTARRADFLPLYPMSFSEYMLLRENKPVKEKLQKDLFRHMFLAEDMESAYQGLKFRKDSISNYLHDIDDIIQTIKDYVLFRNMPFTLNLPETKIRSRVKNILDKIIYNDIDNIKQFNKQTLDKVKSLMFVLADSGDTISQDKLKSQLNLGSRSTIKNILQALKQCELLIEVPPYGKGFKKVRSPVRYQFMSPTFRWSQLLISGKQNKQSKRIGKYLEDIAALYFHKEIMEQDRGSVVYDTQQGGSDFILRLQNKNRLAIEVGKNKTTPKQIIKTIQNRNCDYGIILSLNNDQLDKDEENNVLHIPLKWFLLI